MPLQFQPPDRKNRRDQTMEGFDSAMQTAATIPMLLAQYKNRQKEEQLRALELQLKERELKSRFGTGLPAVNGETPEQKLERIGSESFKALNPMEQQFVIPTYDEQGNVTGFTPAPKGTRVVGGGKPQPSPEEKAAAAQRVKINTERPKAVGSFNNTMREYDNMIAGAQAIKNDTSLGSSTGLLFGRMPVTRGQRRIKENLNTLKAQTLLGVLSSLKDLSKTGASGFGQLSEKEGETIQNSISSLNRTQSTEDLVSSLDRFITEMKARKQNLYDTFVGTYGDNGDVSPVQTEMPVPGDTSISAPSWNMEKEARYQELLRKRGAR